MTEKKKMLILDGRTITIGDIIQAASKPTAISLSSEAERGILASRQIVEAMLKTGDVVYGINTGFGKLANQRISSSDLQQLQKNLIRSHAAGVGSFLSPELVKIILLLKINSFARGYSGIRLPVVKGLIDFFNLGLIPAIHSKGSVGASGDLAPLAELALTVTGEGSFLRADGTIQPASKVLAELNLPPLMLQEKEGLSLINGTQVSTALAISGYEKSLNLVNSLTLLGAFSTEVMLGTDRAFIPEIQTARNQIGQKHAAEMLFQTMQNSGFRHSHEKCDRVQDFYSLRCIPQVHGSAMDTLDYVKSILEREINSATDNPLTISGLNELVSGGNFHAAPIAHMLDFMAIILADLANMSERRIAAFQETTQSQAPMFLVNTPGLNSGFMIAHVTAAALASDCKMLAHPASVDTIPTSANQEDHVSMAPNAGRKLLQLVENVEWIAGIEYLCCAQAADFHRDLALGPITQKFYSKLRERVPFLDMDQVMSEHMENSTELIRKGELVSIWESALQAGFPE